MQRKGLFFMNRTYKVIWSKARRCYVVGIGTNIQFADNIQFYFDAEKSFCADVDMKYRFNAGIRFEF